MDGLIEPIRAALHPRRYGLKNRERTNRLLLLMQLHANGQDDVLAYAKKSERGWRPTTAARAFRAAPSPTDAATPRCADLSQIAPWEACGGAELGLKSVLRRLRGCRAIRRVRTLPRRAVWEGRAWGPPLPDSPS